MKFLLLFSFFLTVLFLFLSLFKLIFRTENKLQNRMEHYLSMSEEQAEGNKLAGPRFSFIQKMKQRIQKKVLTKEKNTRLEIKLAQAGLPLMPEEYILFQWIATALSGGLSFLLTGKWFFILVGAIFGFILPKWYLRKKQRERVTKFNEGLADMITTIVGSLRAGFSFPQALKSVAEEATSPIKDEMESVLKEMQYGKSIEEALHDLSERMPSEDLDLMIQAILIQRQVGGNLATVLDKIVETIRDRTKIHRQISTLTAQGRLSGYVIALLPVFLGLFLYLIQPDYIGTLFHNPIGLAMLAAGLISGIIGFILIKKITNIEV
ncbi:type II secretion system F family protein [Neobacillus novalis]|uniref:Type II secretion system F family protein n=1 Tax=Neobacillus novalis TaxID=220687 RepID=A0AA95MTZ7_9BACI|nr:type II secretion system F family protein [Neobacillus novalis]WHY87713.1 type II secretion system F family protein [Neobacillus novalis]